MLDVWGQEMLSQKIKHLQTGRFNTVYLINSRCITNLII